MRSTILKLTTIILAGLFSFAWFCDFVLSESREFSLAYRQKIKESVVRIDAYSDSLSLKNGQIVWVSGKLNTSDTLALNIRRVNRKTLAVYRGAPIFLSYKESKYKHGKHSGWKTRYLYHYIANTAAIGKIPMDTALISQDMLERRTVYDKEVSHNYKVEIEAIDQGNVSCIAMYKYGMLRATGNKDPFLCERGKDVPVDSLLTNYVDEAESLNNISSICMQGLFIAFLLSLLFCYFDALSYDRESGRSWSLSLKPELKGFTCIYIGMSLIFPWCAGFLVRVWYGASFHELVAMHYVFIGILFLHVLMLSFPVLTLKMATEGDTDYIMNYFATPIIISVIFGVVMMICSGEDDGSAILRNEPAQRKTGVPMKYNCPPDSQSTQMSEPVQSATTEKTEEAVAQTPPPVTDAKAPLPVSNVKTPLPDPEDEIYDVVDMSPSFMGGMDGLMQWLSDNVTYPDAAIRQRVQGRIIVQFVVDKDGSIMKSKTKIVRSIDDVVDEIRRLEASKDVDSLRLAWKLTVAHNSLKQESVRLVNSMPKWRPGMNKCKPARVRYTLPLNFKLPE